MGEVQNAYNAQLPKGWQLRDSESLRRKFISPEDVVRAKRAQRQIEEKYAVTRLDNDNFDPDLGNLDEDADLSDDEPDNNGSRRNLDSQFSELEIAVAEKTPLEADGTGGSAEGSFPVHGTIGPAIDAAVTPTRIVPSQSNNSSSSKRRA